MPETATRRARQAAKRFSGADIGVRRARLSRRAADNGAQASLQKARIVGIQTTRAKRGYQRRPAGSRARIKFGRVVRRVPSGHVVLGDERAVLVRQRRDAVLRHRSGQERGEERQPISRQLMLPSPGLQYAVGPKVEIPARAALQRLRDVECVAIDSLAVRVGQTLGAQFGIEFRKPERAGGKYAVYVAKVGLPEVARHVVVRLDGTARIPHMDARAACRVGGRRLVVPLAEVLIRVRQHDRHGARVTGVGRGGREGGVWSDSSACIDCGIERRRHLRHPDLLADAQRVLERIDACD
jgi:hypothetical protein